MAKPDQQAEELYKDTKAGQLVKAYAQVESTVMHLAGQLEEHPSTPYTRNNAADLTQSTIALRHIGAELRAWHKFLHPDPHSPPKPFEEL